MVSGRVNSDENNFWTYIVIYTAKDTKCLIVKKLWKCKFCLISSNKDLVS